MGPFETDRLRLRKFRADEFETIFRIIYSDPGVYAMYSSVGGDFAAAQERFMEAVYQPNNSEFGRLGVELKEEQILIGQVHLDPHVWTAPDFVVNGSAPFGAIEVELAFAFGKEYWGFGYAYEACTRMVQYAFEELRLPRLVGGAMLENERSVNLHERLGYRLVRNPDQRDVVGWITILDNPGLGAS